MATVIWTTQACSDLVAIEDYYLEEAPAFADVIVDGSLGSTQWLEGFLQSGRAVPDVATAKGV